MSSPLQLTRDAARAVLLAVQGLDRRPERVARKRDVLATIRRMGVLQIDTIHVVARSPYLVLWSRLGHYETRWLEELLRARRIFEYWAHEASFVPIEDFPLFRRYMLERAMGKNSHWTRWIVQNRETSERMLAHIRERGPVMSADFERADGQKGSGWWSWKPEKLALEHLFTSGELMIVGRENFHRRYDLRERAMPDWDDARTPSTEEVRRALAVRAVKVLGVARPRWVADYYRMKKPENAALLRSLVEEGELMVVDVEDIGEALVHPDNIALARRAARGRLQSELTTMLSPFDPIVWDRARALELFDFDYRIECYTPESKRRYGYFVLPILHRGRLVGRLDAKAHRKEGVFELKSVYFEEDFDPMEPSVAEIAHAIRELAVWHGTPHVRLGRCRPNPLRRMLLFWLRD